MQEEDDQVAFTRALVHAVDTVTDIGSSGGKAAVVPNMAEYAVEELGLDFPEYELSSLAGAEPSQPDNAIEGSIRQREDGGEVGSSGFLHILSLLTYENEEGLQNNYVENTGAEPFGIFRSMLRDPEESLYRKPIEEGPFYYDEASTGKSWPEHYATAFEQEKIKKMKEMGLDVDSPGQIITTQIVQMIDDGLNDRKFRRTDGYVISTSDEIKEQAEDYIVNPTKEKREKLENFGRITYSVLEKKIGQKEDEEIYGSHDPIRIEGTLESPEFYHEPQT